MDDQGHPPKRAKVLVAVSVYVVLGLLAFFTLDGNIRIATLVFLGGFALKMYLVVLKSRMD
jgi:hypothetical protein